MKQPTTGAPQTSDATTASQSGNATPATPIETATLEADQTQDPPSIDHAAAGAPPKHPWFESNVFKSVELIAIIFGMGAIITEVYFRFTEDRPLAEATQAELEAGRIDRAYATLSGEFWLQDKVHALNFLHMQGASLSYRDFTCEGLYSPPGERWGCNAEGIGTIWELVLNGSDPERPTGIRSMRFSNMILSAPVMSRLSCYSCSFNGATLGQARLSSVEFNGTDFAGAVLFFNQTSDLSFQRSHLTDATVLDSDVPTNYEEWDFTDAFFLHDQPPNFFGPTTETQWFLDDSGWVSKAAGSIIDLDDLKNAARETARRLGMRQCPSGIDIPEDPADYFMAGLPHICS